MASLPQQLLYTAEEYLSAEREAIERHEWLDGFIYAMAGESPEHSLICANVTVALGTQLKGKPCAVYSPNMKVYARLPSDTGLKGLFAYPDCTVVCGEARFYDKQRDVLINPRVVIEVLSPTTERYDRGKKFLRYQQNSSLTDYVMIAQTYPSVEHYARRADGSWLYSVTTELTASVPLKSIECRLPLADVYDRIAFPALQEDELLQ
ncbi:MAG TPA: Uma2 family endonuclease [Blastocatellia bacterium]|nr:Uma2 family endonuclease [Blastocatellia bacterium]